MKKILSILFSGLMLLNFSAVQAQEINFGEYTSHIITIQVGPEGLDFGPLTSGSGVNSIALIDAFVVEVTGLRFLDVFVEITADEKLLLDGNAACDSDPACNIPFTLQANYNNRGLDDFAASTPFVVSGNISTARFPVLRRTQGPAGPPPPPPTASFNPVPFEENFYIYLYGSLNVGNINAGNYTGEITITISYEEITP
jgi:hypothetical protein